MQSSAGSDFRDTSERAVAECRAYCLGYLAAAATPGEARTVTYERVWALRWPLVKARALERFAQRHPLAVRFSDALGELTRALEAAAREAPHHADSTL